MNHIFHHTTEHHSVELVLVAALVCLLGSCLTVMTIRRLMTATGRRKHIQLVLSSLITGATIWSTHLIAMFAFDPGVPHGYDPVLTAISLIVAVAGSVLVNAAAAYLNKRLRYVTAGITFGLTVSVMHYVGMSAYRVPGHFVWDMNMMIWSALIGAAFGIASFHRIVFPVTRFCWLGGAVFMVASICSMHFTGMAAFEIYLSPAETVPAQILPDTVLVVLITTVVAVILFVGFAALSIETNLERESIAQLHHMATHDELTHLPNRMLLGQTFEQMAEEVVGVPPEITGLAIVSIDLDLFKYINDVHGQHVGDLALKELAQRFDESLAEREFIARVGGDEFVALKSGIQLISEAMTFAQKIHDLITTNMAIDGFTVSLAASLGVTVSLDGDHDMDDLLRKSDLAMARAKEDADHQICLFDAEMDQAFHEKISLIHDLRSATAGKHFHLVYQLQNQAGSREPVGCEVLLRWDHKTRGMVSPGVFIPVAEEVGLISDIGLWVLRTACLEAATWDRPLSMAVNVAPQQLAQPTFVEHLADILMESGLSPSRLELEITEASVIRDQGSALRVIKDIKAMGVRIAMDDFGTGHSSLATLETFPFDKIKIDRSFISEVHAKSQRAAIVRATLSIGQAFGIPVLAEGVETEQELQFLEDAGCDSVQGFFFGQPMPLADIRAITMGNQESLAS